MLYNTILSIVCMAPLIVLSGETRGVFELASLSGRTWWGIMSTGIFGFLINIAMTLQIKYTRSVAPSRVALSQLLLIDGFSSVL